MTRAEVQTIIENHNNEIDNYINNILPSELGKKDNTETITATEWFKAQGLIQKQDFYKKGRAIQLPLRDLGFDVKMDMQSHKLILY